MPFIIGFKKINYFTANQLSTDESKSIKKTMICDICKSSKGVFGWKCKKILNKDISRRLCADCVYDNVEKNNTLSKKMSEIEIKIEKNKEIGQNIDKEFLEGMKNVKYFVENYCQNNSELGKMFINSYFENYTKNTKK